MGHEARAWFALSYCRAVPASVSQLWRFPVKSMAGERLEMARITEATGVLGDRGYALLDVATGRIASAKHPRHWAPLLGFKTRVVERDGDRHPRVAIELPDGKRVHTDDADIDAVLSSTLGREVKLISTPPKQVTYDEFDSGLGDSKAAPLAVGAPEGTFFDFASLHIVTTGTLAKLHELRPESRFEVARFRPNIVVDTGDSSFHENEWAGYVLSIGDEVQAYVEFPCPRCVMTTLAQGDLPADPEILKTATANTLLFPLLAKKLPSVGIYASVVRGGTVRAGDQVRVEGRSAKRAVGKYVYALKRALSRR
jgi:uncharacterized protein